MIAFNSESHGSEAAFKYLVLSAIAGLFFLLGVNLLYGKYGLLNMAGIAAAAATQFSFVDAAALSLIAGALLHDIGKLEEIEVTSRIKGTKKGQLAGHLVLSAIFVSKKCDEIEMDDEIKNKLLHMIVSHHGKSEYGSPKEPMFPEALVVYYSDELSSKVAEMLGFVESAKSETEDDFMYHPRNKKNILLR